MPDTRYVAVARKWEGIDMDVTPKPHSLIDRSPGLNGQIQDNVIGAVASKLRKILREFCGKEKQNPPVLQKLGTIRCEFAFSIL